jgi:glutamate synthase (NADPH/NADH) small chain
MDRPVSAFSPRAAATGRRHRLSSARARPAWRAPSALARLGHGAVIHDARPRAGGLNDYGLATYKMAGGLRPGEVDWLLRDRRHRARAGLAPRQQRKPTAVREHYDAVYLAAA